MRNYKPIFSFLIFCGMVFSATGVLGDDIKIFMSPSSLTIDGSGVESTIEVKIEGTEEINSLKTFEFFLSYNPKVLEIMSVKEGAIFGQSGHPTFWYLYETELGEHIHVADAILGHGLDVKASGTLFSFTVKSLEHGRSNLNFDQVKIGVLSADNSKVVYVPSMSTENGKIIVGNPLVEELPEANLRKLIIPELTATPGDTVTVPINVTDATGIAGAEIVVTYDEKVMTIKECKTTTLSNGMNLIFNTETAGYLNLSLSANKAIAEGSGAIVAIIVEVSAAVRSSGKGPLTLKDATLYDDLGNDIPINVVNVSGFCIASVSPSGKLATTWGQIKRALE